MTADMSIVRTARKPHHCGSCDNRIEPKEKYRRWSLPPNSELGNLGWWSENECSDCATLWRRPIGGAS